MNPTTQAFPAIFTQNSALRTILRPLIPPLGPPFGQREPLHGAEDPVLEVRVAALKLEDQFLDFLPLGVLVSGTAVFDDGQLHFFAEIISGALGDVEHGPDLDDPHPVEVGHRLEAGNAAFIQKAHDKGTPSLSRGWEEAEACPYTTLHKEDSVLFLCRCSIFWQE